MANGGTVQPEPWPYDPTDAAGWPDAQDCEADGTFNAELCKAKLEVRKKRTDESIARDKANRDARIAITSEYYKAVLEVAKGSIDRTRASADTVQKAAAAIVTLYTGILALAFAADGTPLPPKALFAAVLLGLSVLLSTAFLAYLPGPEPRQREEGGAEDPRTSYGDRVTATFVDWSRRASLERGGLLRSSVAALAGAVILLPAPFVALGDGPVTESNPEAWPTLDQAAGDDAKLSKILYTAQVAEVAEQRKAPLAEDENYTLWWILFAAALIGAVVAYFWAPSGRRPASTSTSTTRGAASQARNS